MTAAQWRGIAKRTRTYLEGYRDKPGSQERSQRRAEWIAALPVFEWADRVFEIGCGCGRNLAALRRRYPNLSLSGCDVCPEAIEACRADLPGGQFFQCDLAWCAGWMDVSDRVNPVPDVVGVVLSVGVLGHLHSSVCQALLVSLMKRAAGLIVVEEEGCGEVAKGPRVWGAEKNTGDYVLWRHPITEMLVRTGVPRDTAQPTPLPPDLQAPGATKLWVVTQ